MDGNSLEQKVGDKRRHAADRMQQHYQVTITAEELHDIETKIAHYDGPGHESLQPFERLPEGRYLWLIRHEEHWYPAVWYAFDQRILTILPSNASVLRPPHCRKCRHT